MKNRRNTYILLVLVLGIWGAIAYQVISEISPSDIPKPTPVLATSFYPLSVKEKDTFSIHTYSRDPFFGAFKTPAKPKKSLSKPKKAIVWPLVTYKGMISDTNASENIYFLQINNQQYMLKTGKEINGVRLIRADKTTATVRYQNEQKTIAIQK
ncbi:hypothetical protein [Leptobacterium sp. I13]|uniref:hypothetical protein n=1 Tax=Leptobacterium meishanense TaxID=3128904 RepID=UPI0030EC9826